MEMFVWWEDPISMRVEWKCASMTNGGQCVMTAGAVLMLQLSVSSWDMHTLEVSSSAGSISELVQADLIDLCICRWYCIQQCSVWCWYRPYLPG